ncbi:hypothetical protein BpHYR1_029964 [Brachionus plicatilis]|uniref:Uncharacterized protein n=1 Tax=Brachionus plicatilis TaxID=10195 RepID=A0A3M7P3M7_BRAPC|nr:hypothetical protein BpHYR1_029964 [Brachionus plicatilis]
MSCALNLQKLKCGLNTSAWIGFFACQMSLNVFTLGGLSVCASRCFGRMCARLMDSDASAIKAQLDSLPLSLSQPKK